MTDRTSRAAHRTNRRLSLNLRMVLVVLAGILAAYLTFSAMDELSYQVITRVYMDAAAQKQREQTMVARLTDYVQQNELSSTDSAALGAWCRQTGDVYISVYKDGYEILGTDGSYVTTTDISSYTDDENIGQAQEKAQIAANNTYNGVQQLELPAGEEELGALTYGADWYGTLYTVPFADGDALVSLVEYSELHYYTLASTFSLVLAIAVLVGVILLFTARLTRRVTAMSRMVARVAAGELEAPITVRGTDEVAQLAADVDAMRGTIVERLRSEQAAWQANNQLITAISHDIRNPLTSLIGYADLLASGQETDPGHIRQYLSACRDKAYQLKTLTDELFGYFVVFGSPKLKVETERLDLRILLEQLLGEAVFRLQSEGRAVEYTPLPEQLAIFAELDPALLKRLFDNLFSNIDKYADPAHPVLVQAVPEPDAVTVTLKNAVAPRSFRTESSSIGLRTCKRIAQELLLDFDCGSENTPAGEWFRAAVRIPAQPGE